MSPPLAEPNERHSQASSIGDHTVNEVTSAEHTSADNKETSNDGAHKTVPDTKEVEHASAPSAEPVTPKPTPSTASAVPDGGRIAWQTVLGCFLAFFAFSGFAAGFGVFQSYYEAILPNRSSDDIAWIGSFQLWSITGLSIPSVLLNAHVGPHITLAIGMFFTVFGVMMASISKQYYQFLLSHGVCVGIGIGLTFLPIVGLPNQWFNKRRGLAVGLALGGSSVGGVIWPIMVNQMLNFDGVGYPWTMRAIGFVQLAIVCVAIALIRSNVPRNRTIKLSSFHTPLLMAIKSLGIDLFAIALLLHFFGIYIPYLYAPLYAESLGASPNTAFYVASVLNAATFFGRFVMGSVSDRLGHGNTLLVTVFLSAMLAFAWQGVSSTAGVFVWVVFYGWFSGASVSLQSPAIVPLVPEPKLRLMGPYIAILCQFSSFGSLGGGPIAGRLLHDRIAHHMARDGNALGQTIRQDFHPMMWFTGAILLGACAFYIGARMTFQKKLWVKI